VLYPSTPQEVFESLVAGFFDPNPCIVMENKLLYTRSKGAISFDGDTGAVWRARKYRDGSEITVVATGAMVEQAIEAADDAGCSADVWNPLVLRPLDVTSIVDSVRSTGRLLVVQEAPAVSGFADRIVSQVCQAASDDLRARPVVVAAPDTPVPFAPELETAYRPGRSTIAEAMTALRGVTS
jgi:pyruvate/2-oxoglutarate/acetoin dehydrogenase E1 component